MLLLGLLVLGGFGYLAVLSKLRCKNLAQLYQVQAWKVTEPLPEAALPAAERAPELQATTELTLPPADATALPSNAVTPPVATAVANPADASQCA